MVILMVMIKIVRMIGYVLNFVLKLMRNMFFFFENLLLLEKFLLFVLLLGELLFFFVVCVVFFMVKCCLWESDDLIINCLYGIFFSDISIVLVS